MARPAKYDFCDEGFLARLERLHLIAKRMAAQGPAGPRRSRWLGDGLEFADHRDYAAGDDLRFIDWPYYARMEKLLLRLFHEHSESDVAILLDRSGSMSPGAAVEKFNYARMTAAAVAFIAMGGLQRVILAPLAETLDEPLRTGRNKAQIIEALEFLARVKPAGKTDLLAAAQAFARRFPSAGTVVLISDLLNSIESLGDVLARLQLPSRDVIVLHVYSPADAAPRLEGPMLLAGSEDGRRMSLNITKELLASYRGGWAEFQRACQHACIARKAVYVAAPTDMPFDQLILRALRRAGVVAL
ncbi:MAG: DUF58 domain-containing protein [Phycisphaerae bacterium]